MIIIFSSYKPSRFMINVFWVVVVTVTIIFHFIHYNILHFSGMYYNILGTRFIYSIFLL